MGKLLLAAEFGHVVPVWEECLSSAIFSQPALWEEAPQAVRDDEWSLTEMAAAGSEEAC